MIVLAGNNNNGYGVAINEYAINNVDNWLIWCVNFHKSSDMEFISDEEIMEIMVKEANSPKTLSFDFWYGWARKNCSWDG